MKVLVTGATGLVGTRLCELLEEQGNQVVVFTRNLKKGKGLAAFEWNPEQGKADKMALNGVDAVVNLAGEGVADKAWSAARKKQILDSRINSLSTLHRLFENSEDPPKTLLSVSGVDYYGNTGTGFIDESHPPGTGFLAKVCLDWEAEALRGSNYGMRVIIFRVGLVLSNRGGALPKMTKTLPLGIANTLGSGNQYVSWIHLDDLCQMIIHAIENPAVSGVFNAVAPNPVTATQMTKTLIEVKNRWAFNFPVPAPGLRLVLGEMAEILLDSHRISCEKIKKTGFSFRYNTIKDALKAC